MRKKKCWWGEGGGGGGGGEGRDIILPIHILGTKRGGLWSTPRPDCFTPGRDPVLIVQEVGWASELCRRAWNILPPPGFTLSSPQQVTALTVLSQLPFVQPSHISIQSYSIAQVTGQHFRTVEPWVQSHSSPYGICGGQNGTAAGSCLSTVASNCTTDVILPLKLHICLLFTYLSSTTKLFYT